MRSPGLKAARLGEEGSGDEGEKGRMEDLPGTPGFPSVSTSSAYPASGVAAKVPPSIDVEDLVEETGKDKGKVPEQIGLDTLFRKMSAMDLNMQSNFNSLQKQLADQATAFTQDIANLRADMVSRSEFAGLEKRIEKLEAGSLASVQISWMQT